MGWSINGISAAHDHFQIRSCANERKKKSMGSRLETVSNAESKTSEPRASNRLHKKAPARLCTPGLFEMF